MTGWKFSTAITALIVGVTAPADADLQREPFSAQVHNFPPDVGLTQQHNHYLVSDIQVSKDAPISQSQLSAVIATRVGDEFDRSRVRSDMLLLCTAYNLTAPFTVEPVLTPDRQGVRLIFWSSISAAVTPNTRRDAAKIESFYGPSRMANTGYPQVFHQVKFSSFLRHHIGGLQFGDVQY